jgi:hypothetical protein
MEIKRKAKKIATQTTSTPKAQIQLCVGRIAIMIASRQRWASSRPGECSETHDGSEVGRTVPNE